MSSATDQDAGSAATPLADSGLRCPKCEYNLTGIIENRCPECGSEFDPERLRAILAGAPAPIPIWDDSDRNIISRFFLMCLLTWFAPWRLARMFPRCYRLESARKFRLMAIALALCLVVAWLWLEYGWYSSRPPNDAWILIGVLVGSWAGVAACEAINGGTMIAFLAPEDCRGPCPDQRADYGQFGVVGFFRTFVILSAAATCWSVHRFALGPPWATAPTPEIAVLGVAVWWWGALSAAVLAQPAPLRSRIAFILFIPLGALFSVLVGATVGILVLVPLSGLF